jgi:hypothetical protein
MNKTDFKLFLNDITLGLFVLLFILFLFNISGIFDRTEISLKPKLMWRDLVKKDSVNTAQIIFTGNSQSFYVNPIIIDSITDKSSQFFGFNGATILSLSWFFSNSWDYLNPELVVLETHSFRASYLYDKQKDDHPRFSKSTKYINDISLFMEKNLNFSDLINLNKSELTSLITGPAIENHHIIESRPYEVYKVLFPNHNNTEDHIIGFLKSNYSPISDGLLNTYNNNWIPFPDTRIESDILPTVEYIIKECQTRGIKVLIYESPMYYKHFKPQIQRREQIYSFCQQLNIPFVDLNLESSLTRNPNYFENTKSHNQHLTSDGGNAVSKVLADKILQLKLLSKVKKE